MPAVSPDGRSFAYTGVTGGTQPMLWVRRLDALQPMVLPGTENAERPFWSPDSRSVAFLARGTLKEDRPEWGAPTSTLRTGEQPGCDMEPERHHRLWKRARASPAGVCEWGAA